MKRINKTFGIYSLLIATLFSVAALADGFAPGVRLDGTVVAVLDGDTVSVLVGRAQEVRVRLAEIDAPEKTQAFGQVSKKSLSDLVYGKSVQVRVIDTDRYGRTVGRISVNGIDVNLEQVNRGLAWAYDQYVKDPSITAAQLAARKRHAGLWADANPIAPWLYRRAAK